MAADKRHEDEGRFVTIFRPYIRHPKTGEIIRPKRARAFPIRIPVDELPIVTSPRADLGDSNAE